MGQHFPSRDPRWRGADSRVFVAEVARLLREGSWRLGNVDVTVIAQEPVLAPHLAAMRSAIAAALGVAEESVSVKAKSTDHMGAFGRGEGIAALATALVTKEQEEA
jgi:2-C-methyl-D-erythritol 2,4-cyclodiphosphate synthase